ncbi:MAG TPA: hypothetical protein VF516_46410, partial [Kofleriaceae bacterium]
MGILGDFGKTIASSAPTLERLIAAAELHHAFSFDPISHGVTRLDYEPRCSASCAEPGCQAIWVGSKAGEIFHLRFGADEPRSTKSWVNRSVRALVHVHRIGMLIAGTDHGHLVLFEGDGEQATQRYVHLESWFEQRGTQPCPYDPGHRIDSDEDPFNDGITAILELPAEDPAVVDIVVATRYPALYVVRLQRDALAVRARHLLPGWTQCLTTLGPSGDENLVCASRGGELLEWRCRALRDDPTAAPVPTLTHLLPNAIGKRSGQLPEQQTTLLIGATDGLYMCRTGAATPEAARPVQLAATRSAVLSIAVVTIRAPRASEPMTYVALGLEDGRLRVIEERALFGVLDGRDALQAHDFPVVLGDAVLALEVLASDDPTACFVFAALRDHRVRLYRACSREALCEQLDALWRTAIDEPAAIRPAALGALLVREAELRRSVGSKHENALRYWLADEVLRRWTASGAERVVARACEIAKGADEKVLYRLSARIGDIAGTDVNALIRLSMACLVAMPERDARRWRAFVSYHLKQFHACVRRVADHADLSRLQYWGRFVRKYLLLGETFADKRYRIESLMKRNRETRKYLDALIYAAQLERQRYDLKWSEIACQDDDGRDQEIARVDLIDDCAIVVTASAEVVFFDVQGERLPIFSSQGCLDRLVPLRGDRASGLIRTRAARVVRRDGTWVRIALSWAGASTLASHQLRVTIFDLRLTRSGVMVEGVHVATTSQSRRGGAAELEAHGLVGLPNQDAFLVGLDSSESPLALLKLAEDGPDGPTWVLSLLEMSRAPGSPDALPAV